MSASGLALQRLAQIVPDAVGNRVSEDDQRRKLALVVETARQVWG